MTEKTGIALIGFMGTGKSAVGRRLAQKLGKGFIETDAEVEKRAGKPVSAIFREQGEAAFRALEKAVVAEVAAHKNIVAACGGGVVLELDNIFRLRPNYVIVCLSASPEEILKRVLADGETRPLLNVADKLGKIRELLAARLPLYTQAADFTVDTSGLAPDGVADEIIRILGSHENNA
jgi:shikimate kinase